MRTVTPHLAALLTDSTVTWRSVGGSANSGHISESMHNLLSKGFNSDMKSGGTAKKWETKGKPTLITIGSLANAGIRSG